MYFQLAKHKYLEISFNNFKKDPQAGYSYFAISLYWNTRQDHAGLVFSVEVLGRELEFNLYDNRHWNYDKQTWEKHQDD